MAVAERGSSVGLHAPQGFPGLCVHCGERSTVLAEEDDATSRRQHAAPTVAGTDLRYFPDSLSCLEIDRTQELLSGFCFFAFCAPAGRLHVDSAGLQRLNIEQLC